MSMANDRRPSHRRFAVSDIPGNPGISPQTRACPICPNPRSSQRILPALSILTTVRSGRWSREVDGVRHSAGARGGQQRPRGGLGAAGMGRGQRGCVAGPAPSVPAAKAGRSRPPQRGLSPGTLRHAPRHCDAAPAKALPARVVVESAVPAIAGLAMTAMRTTHVMIVVLRCTARRSPAPGAPRQGTPRPRVQTNGTYRHTSIKSATPLNGTNATRR